MTCAQLLRYNREDSGTIRTKQLGKAKIMKKYEVITEEKITSWAKALIESFDAAYNILHIVFEYDHQRADADKKVIMHLLEVEGINPYKSVRIGDITAAYLVIITKEWDFQPTRVSIERLYGDE